MPRTLVVPGVSVETRFDVPPPLPARSGILGAVGVVDRIPADGIASVTSTQELFDVFGPATRFSFPEAVSALVNGVSEVVVSPVPPGTGQAAQIVLKDDEDDDVALLRARAVGPWGNDLSVRVTRNLAPDRRTVRRVSLEVLYKGGLVDRFDNLLFRPGDANDFFMAINRDSTVIVALDPVFRTDLPALDSGLASLAENEAAAASGTLTAGGAALVKVKVRKTGSGGNSISVAARSGHATVVLKDSADQPALRVRALDEGPAGTSIRVSIADDGSGGVNATVETSGGTRSYLNKTSIAALVAALNGDPAIGADRVGNLLPAPTAAPVSLAATVTVTICEEGVRTDDYADLADATAIAAALQADPAIQAEVTGTATLLPDPTKANAFYLSGGMDAGRSRRYAGQNNPAAELLELRPVEGVAADSLRVCFLAGSAVNTVRLTVGQQFTTGYQQQESMDDLSMDPDDPRYLPATVEKESAFLRVVDFYQRAHATNWPVGTPSPRPLDSGAAPAAAAWQTAIDALAAEEDVDLVLAGLQEWKDANLDGVQVQQSLVAHARAQGDAARPRIALSSVKPAENPNVSGITGHAGLISDRRSVLVAPAGAEGALAGLLGHLEYFQSPTFKTIAMPGVPLQAYSDAELTKLVGSEGNVCVIAQRRGRGSVCVKGICTDGFQISVVRVADRCIREVKKISDRFIGELNNSDSRIALREMIVAVFGQMERDGALVPSVDGSSPAFQVEVYASQNDVAAGNARVDIAVRPVRAIDYIYATIRVKN